MNKFTRRDFLKIINRFAGAIGLSALFAPVLAYFFPPSLEETPSEPVRVGPEGDLALGDGKTVAFGRYPALVIQTPEGLKAYSAVCTHFACICQWDPEIEQIACPCHEGYFDPLDGSVISGPPPSPLKPLHVEVIEGDIFVSDEGEA
ncbi:MAG: Rieske (2Fe-2S) protein [Chloroflexota bacterium]